MKQFERKFLMARGRIANKIRALEKQIADLRSLLKDFDRVSVHIQRLKK